MGEGYSIRVLEKAIDVMMVFHGQENELSLAQICAYTGLPKSTVFRVVNTLTERNFLGCNLQTGKYHLGFELVRLALRGSVFISLAYPYLEELEKKTGQSCNIYIRDGFERICVAQTTSNNILFTNYSTLGRRLPLYVGTGKLLLAYAGEEFIENYLKNVPLTGYTERTITDKDVLRKTLVEIRKKGYVITRGERELFSAVVAAPIFDYSQTVVAAITVRGLGTDFTDEKTQFYLESVLKVAHDFSSALGYRQ